jgi:hypothetical protein
LVGYIYGRREEEKKKKKKRRDRIRKAMRQFGQKLPRWCGRHCRADAAALPR